MGKGYSTVGFSNIILNELVKEDCLYLCVQTLENFQMSLNNEFSFPTPSPEKLPRKNKFYKEILKRHEEACQNKQNTYIDPESGLIVFTAYYHLERGNCCGSGCRHCPFGE